MLLPVSYCTLNVVRTVAMERQENIFSFCLFLSLNFIYSLAKDYHSHNPPLQACQKINDIAVFLRTKMCLPLC